MDGADTYDDVSAGETANLLYERPDEQPCIFGDVAQASLAGAEMYDEDTAGAEDTYFVTAGAAYETDGDEIYDWDSDGPWEYDKSTDGADMDEIPAPVEQASDF